MHNTLQSFINESHQRHGLYALMHGPDYLQMIAGYETIKVKHHNMHKARDVYFHFSL